MDDRISTLAQRALKWGSLKRKENKDKKLAITIFSFPPDKGNVGTAAYLDVFGSILAVAKELKGRGYDLGDVDPNQMEAEDLMDMVLNDKEAKFDSYCVQRPCYVAAMASSRRWRRRKRRASTSTPSPRETSLTHPRHHNTTPDKHRHAARHHRTKGSPSKTHRPTFNVVHKMTMEEYEALPLPGRFARELGPAARPLEQRRPESACVRREVRQRLHRRPAVLRLRGRPHAPAVLEVGEPAPRLRGLLHVPRVRI